MTDIPIYKDTDEDINTIIDDTEESTDDISTDVLKLIHRLYVSNHDGDKLIKAITDLKDELGESEFVKQWEEFDTYAGTLSVLSEGYTDQLEYLRRGLAYMTSDKVGQAFKSDDVNLTNASFKSKRPKEKELSGNKATMMIRANRKNIKRVILYNSGFYIVMRAPSIDEINVLYNQLSDETKTYGSIFGLLFYLYADQYVRDHIWKFIESLVVDSNLVNFNRDGVLKKAVSASEYNNILVNLGSLIYRDGYPIVHTCINPDCKAVCEDTIDISLLQQTDFSKMTSDQMKSLLTPKRTAKDIREYKANFSYDNDSITIDNFTFHYTVPSMHDFSKHGDTTLSDLMECVSNMSDISAIRQYLTFRYNSLFAPWIDSVDVLNDTGEMDFMTKDKDSIIVALNELQNDSKLSNTLKDDIEKFMGVSEVTHVGYTMDKCSECNVEFTGTSNGFVPVDVQNLLFTMSVMKLIQVS